MKFKLSACLAVLSLAVMGCGGGHKKSHHVAHSQPRYTVTINGHQYRSAHPPGFGRPTKGLTLPRRQTGVQTLEQYDSIDVGTVPGCGGNCSVAGYTGGSWPTFNGLVRAFPSAFHVPIAVYNGGALTAAGTNRIMCLDIEPGDATPSDAGPWARYTRTHGMNACEYSSLSEMGAVRSNLAAWGELNTTILWDANWTYSRHLDAGYGCTQWTDRSLGRNLDESTCAAGLFGAPAPLPDPFAVFSKTNYDLGHKIKASEYLIVKGWNDRHCSNPTRRPVCGFLRYRLVLLRGRLWTVAHYSHPANFADFHRHERMEQFQYDLHMTRGPWKVL